METKMHTVVVRFPTDEHSDTYRKFERKFSNYQNADQWCRERDQQIDQERGNRWAREILIDGKPSGEYEFGRAVMALNLDWMPVA